MSVFVVALLSALASALLNPTCFNMPVLAVGDPTKRICSLCECCLLSSTSVNACVVVLVLPSVVPARAD
eukprot:10919648-Alexandrium_andersonii.AAC.1